MSNFGKIFGPPDVYKLWMNKDTEGLIKALKHDDPKIRRDAASVYSSHLDPNLVEPLIEALGDEDQVVRKYAISSLGYIGDPRAIEALIPYLKDEDTDLMIAKCADATCFDCPKKTGKSSIIYLPNPRDKFIDIKFLTVARAEVILQNPYCLFDYMYIVNNNFVE